MFLKRGQNLLQNGILNFAFKLSQSSGITFEREIIQVMYPRVFAAKRLSSR